jgi:stress response protein YsnF/sporulation protein YlmC with PRC-barrel domain
MDGNTIQELAAAQGRAVVDSDGTRLGDVDAIYYDNETEEPEWIGIATGFIATNRVVVPAQSATVDGDAVRVPYDEATVKAAPTIDGDEISPELERNLYRHYGLDYSEREQRIEDVRSEADTEVDYAEGAPADDYVGEQSVADTAATDASVTRSEEELLVGKREVEAGRVRVRKWVETEPVAVDIDLQHERARVVREDINEPVDGADFGDQELEVTLRAEEPMIEKHIVAKERIRLETDVHVETATISDEVRKERVEVEGADDDGAA